MQKEQTYRAGNVLLRYKVHKHHVVVTGASKIGNLLELPSHIDGLPVTEIARKAFLASAMLKRVIFPESVTFIDHWALAQCRSLVSVICRNPNVEFGKGVFDDCDKIRYICLGSETEDALAALLGTLPMRLSDEHLMRAQDIGEPSWYAKWDQKLLAFLREPDEEGYTNLVLCGEEDISHSVPGYVEKKRIEKAALCLIRLRYAVCLSADTYDIYAEYILSNRKGCAFDAAWQALMLEFKDEMAYYKLFAELGGITADNIGDMLIDLGDSHAEAKAFLMKYQAETFGKQDIFDSFSL